MILCVEDEPMVLATRAMVLRTGGFAVRGAGSAREALELLSAEIIDAVVLDANLPEIDVDAIALAMKRLKPRLRIVMFSTQPAVPSGAIDACLTRGESPQTLLDTLRALLPM